MSVQENGSQEEPCDLMASGLGGSTEIKEPLLANYSLKLPGGWANPLQPLFQCPLLTFFKIIHVLTRSLQGHERGRPRTLSLTIFTLEQIREAFNKKN